MSRQEQQLDAAEYVIGTLSGVERKAFEDLIASSKQTQEDVWYWEQAFGALNASISPQAPSAAMWERIEGSLPADAVPGRLSNILRVGKGPKKKVKQGSKPQSESKQELESALKSKSKSGVRAEKAAKTTSVQEAGRQKPGGEKQAPDESGKVAIKPDSGLDGTQIGVLRSHENANPAPESSQKNRKTSSSQLPETVTKKAGEARNRSAPAAKPLPKTRPADDVSLLRRWKLIALAAILAVFGLAAYIVSQWTVVDFARDEAELVKQNGKQYLAVVNANGDQPSLVVRVNPLSGSMKVDPVGIVVPKGKSLQLWHYPAGGKRVSVGLVKGDMPDFQIANAKPGDLLEISLEKEGGVAGDEPVGPVVYTGELQEISAR